MKHSMKRREFLTIPAAALGGTLLYTLAREPFRLQAQDGVVKVPLRFFTEAEARVIAAACERIFPSDTTGPGAKEAGVVIYIDRQLAGPYGADKYRYTKGPFVESVPEHGYQGKENPRETYHQGIAKLGTNFAELAGGRTDPEAAVDGEDAFLPIAAGAHSRRHVLGSHARRERGADWLATGGISGAAHELQRGHRPTLWLRMAAETGRPGADHEAQGKSMGGREGLASTAVWIPAAMKHHRIMR